MNINELNDAWIASGQKVSDMDAKLSALVMDDSFDEIGRASCRERVSFCV